MGNCFRCGASEGDKKLFDGISGKGIVKICEDCLRIEKFPLIKKPVEKVEEKQKSVRERLVGMNSRFNYGKEPSLRDLIDEKYKAKNPQVHSDMIDNFHWTIQRIRRVRRITREEFAKGIGESDAVVRMIESGFLPEDNYKVVAKVEKFLGTSLRKSTSGFPNTDERKFVLDNSLIQSDRLEDEPKQLGFDYNSVRKLKIGDLNSMKKKQEKEKNNPVEWEEEYTEEDLVEEEED